MLDFFYQKREKKYIDDNLYDKSKVIEKLIAEYMKKN